jgi:transglutaminase-like putative cysteine protease
VGAGVDDRNEKLMGNGLGRLAGAAAFVMMLLRLGELLDSGPEAPDWQLIMIASAFLGGVIWWLLGQTLASKRLAIILFVVAGLFLFLRIAVSDTLALGFLPTVSSFEALGDELGQTLNLIRFGVAPVFPTSGLVAILALLMWGTGALYVWGAAGGPTLAMIAPSLGLYLQFAVMDRIQAGLPWMIALAAVTALSLAALGVERRSEAGRARDAEGRPLARRAGSVALILASLLAGSALLVTDTASPLVPMTGNIRWRYGGGYGPGFGGTTFDRLADLQQSFIRRSNAVMFVATLDPDAPPANQIYWRMESLDEFDGEAWRPTTSRADFYQPGVTGENPEHAYRGTSQEVTQRVRIVDLRSAVVPTVGIGRFFRSESVDVNGFQITADGSAIYQPELDEDDEYEALSVLPLSQEDLGALATGSQGTLSPLFANAAEAGETSLEPGPPPGDVSRPESIDRFTELDLDGELTQGLAQIARRQTAGASTPFEAAWLLEHWFRESGEFDYSTEVSTGHAALDLVAWLDDEESENYRTGYCEQFAAAMAVLGRTLQIPSRVVWGFTPGSVEESNGTEIIVVRDRNAHAWVEMWMDGFGWVRFDPTPRADGAVPDSITAGFDPNEYLPERDGPLTLSEPLPFESQFEEGLEGFSAPTGDAGSGFRLTWAWLALPVLALLIGLVPMLKWVRRRRRIKRLHEGDITAAWDEIVDRLADLRTPVPAHQTPLEFARATGKDLVPLASSYSATVYGNRSGQGHVSDLTHAETWIDRNYETWDRTLAAFNPRSLIERE